VEPDRVNTIGAAIVGDVVSFLDGCYPPAWAADWDRVGLVVGDPGAAVGHVHFVIDCVAETVAEAIANGAGMIVAHHPLLLRGVSSVAATTYKGRIVRDLIKNDIALFVAHTNADHASPGVSDSLARRLGLGDLRPLRPAAPEVSAGTSGSVGTPAGEVPAAGARPAGVDRGAGRIGRLPAPMTFAAFTAMAAAALPATAVGIRAAGDPDRPVVTVAVCGGAGDTYLDDAVRGAVDAYVTSDLRHHPASEHLAGGGPALIDATHWATERPWLDDVAGAVRDRTGLNVTVSDLATDPWTSHVSSTLTVPSDLTAKEQRL
jgi:dinuclear metal center YbgI/SA1388 family protein